MDFLKGLPTRPVPSGGPPDPSRTFGRATRPVHDIQKKLPTHPGPPGGSLDPSRTSVRKFIPLVDLRVGLPPFQTSRRASRHLPNFREGLLTRPGPPGGPPDPYQTSVRASQPVSDLRVGP